MSNLEAANSTFTSTVVLTDDLLYCPNCNKELTQPKVLECLHSFCLDCLEICLKRNNILAGHAFLCPICRTQCRVPEDGVEKIKDNNLVRSMQSFLNFRNELLQDVSVKCSGCEKSGLKKSRAMKCIECNDWLCRKCSSIHSQVKASKSHHLYSTEELMSGNLDGIIKEHMSCNSCLKHKERFSTYCIDCKCLLCQMCEITSHVSHEVVPMKEQSEKDSMAIQSFLPSVSRTIESLRTKISNLSKQQKGVTHFRKTFHKMYADRIIDIINKMTKELHDYSDFLHKTVDGLASDHLEKIANLNLQDWKNRIEAAKVAVITSEQLLKFNYTQNTMALRDLLHRQLPKFQFKEVQDPYLTEHLQYFLSEGEEPTEGLIEKLVGGLCFDARPKYDTSLYSFLTKLETDSRPCVISDMTVDNFRGEVVVIDEANKNLKVFDFEGSLTANSSEGFLKAPIRVTVLGGDVFYLVNDGNSLKLASKQLDQLTIFSSYKFRQPVAMTQSTNGEILVAEWMSGEIIGFDETGTVVRHFPCFSRSPAYLSCCFDSDHVILSDWGTHTIRIFHWNGTFIASYGQQGDGPGCLDHPHGVASDPENRIIVCDSWNNRIEVLDWKGRHITTILDRKNGLLWPQAIAILRQHCFVVERHGAVKIFEYDLSSS